MKQFKYLIYLLAAIAAPLWIALSNFGSKPADSKTTFALDSTSIQLLSKAVITQPPTSNSTQVNINGTHLDSLFMFLAKSNVQNNSQRDKSNDQLQTSIKALTDISISNSKTLESLLSKDRNIRVSVDPITVNQPTSNSNTPSNPYQSSFDNIYDLKENGPFPSWEINSNIVTQEVLIVLNNSSKSYPVTIDKIEPMFNDKNDTVSIKDLPSIEPLNQAVIKYPGYKYDGKFYIIGKYIKTKKRLFGKVETTYTNFKIPMSLHR